MAVSKSVQHQSDIRAPQSFRLYLPKNWQWHQFLGLFVSDVLALGLAWGLARYLNQFYSPIPSQLVWWSWLGLPSLFWLFAGAILILFAQGGLYSSSPVSKNYLRAGQLVSSVYLFSLVVSYFYDPKLDPPRSLFFSAWFGSVGLIILFRLMTTLLLRQAEQKQPKASVFIIAPKHRLCHLQDALTQRTDRGEKSKNSRYHVVGTAEAKEANTPATLQAIYRSCATEVFAEALPQSELASALYWQLRSHNITLHLIPSSQEMLHRRGTPEVLAGIPTLRVETPWFVGWDYRIKRAIDLIGATFGIIILSPLLLAVAIAIKITSPGPIFFRQKRMGLQGKVFKMWKFRTMVENAVALQTQLEAYNQNQDGVMFKLEHDPRLTPIGKFLRRTSIDELPQLFNIIRGEMSLVGPRPLPLRDISHFESWHHTRHHVLPGITGLWQISGRSDLDTFDDVAKLDLYYIDNWSLNLDLDILVETFRIVLFGKGAY